LINPMLCETGSVRDLKRQGYVAEKKYDGTRLLVIKENGKVTLQNRRGIIYTARLPEIVRAAKTIPEDFIIDGEVVYVNPETGKEEFTPCQRRCATNFPDPFMIKKFPVTLMAFDILKFQGENVTDRPFHKRKFLLHGILLGRDTIQYVPYRYDLEEAWKEVQKEQEEGLILKDLNSRYENRRSYSWLKIKNWRPPEVCEVVGFTQGKNARNGLFGSLVLSRNGKYRGCVGSGFSDWELRQIKDILADAPRIQPPFDIGEPYVAVRTDLKVEVKYYKTTEAGVMRFPVFVRVAE